jgi:UDP-N-acetylmuramate--alanine ligase
VARGIAVLHRSDLLQELMSLKRGLAVAGAHGKSTTSALLALALGESSACVGAALPGGDGTGARWGSGPWFVAEADESDRSLLRLLPEAAILLNVDHDHHATYASLAEVEEVMREFVAAIPQGGALVVGPDARALACAEAAVCEVITVGDGGDYNVSGSGAGAIIARSGGEPVAMPLSIPGLHNAQNAACAVALAVWCGVDLETAVDRIADFTGVGRRFEHVGAHRGIVVVDDYAHHPAEITATITAAREINGGRLVVVFQPHLPSRTQALATELGIALGGADVVYVTDIYLSREAPIPGLDGGAVARHVPRPPGARYVPYLTDVTKVLAPQLRPGDLVLTLGAGDVTRLGQELLAAVKNLPCDGDVHRSDPRPAVSDARRA